MNGFIPKEFESLIENRTFFINKYKTEVINIVYAGNIYEGRRNPNQLIQTIANCNSKAEINIHFFGLYLENIKEFVNVNKFSDFVFFHSVKPRKEILEICKAADFNLFLESGNDDARGVLTGKLFELIAIGRPIIVIGPMRDFKSCQIIEEAGLLVHWDMLNLENIYFSLSKYKLNTWVNFSKIDKYSREMQVMKIIPYINH